MCMLCSQPIFPTIDAGRNERERLQAKALRLKQEIKTHEMLLNQAKQLGIPPCPTTVEGLERLRSEQFELARKL